jgi:hypothetical protein
MKEQIKYDIDDEVLVNIPELEVQKVGTISMILINRKGIQYRAKFGYDKQYTFSQDDVISRVEEKYK